MQLRLLLIDLLINSSTAFMLTGAIYLGGAGSVIVGGLYWKHSSTLDAWMGMITGLKALLPSNEFSVWDKFLYYALTGWILGWFVVFIMITAWHFLFGVSDSWWLGFWKFKLWLTVILGIMTTVWFFIGGVSDFRDIIRSLRTKVRQTQDDGRVHKE